MNWRIFFFFIAIVVFLQCNQKKTDEIKDVVVPVRLASVIQKEMSKPVIASGRLSTSAEMKLSFKIGGIVDAIYVSEGQKVKKGTLLATLKVDEIEAKVKQAKAGYEKAKRDFIRAQNLYRDSVATLEQLQNAETGLNVAENNLKIAQFNLDHARIIAPEKGVVLKVISEENELIGAGSPVCLFGSQSKIWKIISGLTDQEVVRVNIGDKASVRFDAYPEQVVHAVVNEIAGAPNPMSGTYEIVLGLESNSLKLFSGFIAKLEIYPSISESVHMIPFISLINIHDNQGEVFLPTNDLTVTRVPVKIGYLTEEKAVITAGLDSVSKVITDGAAYLKEGIKIKIVE